jgi:hypothetical protein
VFLTLCSGPYSVTLDGTQTLFDGFSATAIFGTLFVSDVLKQGKHTVTVTNQLTDTTKPFLDLDFVRARSQLNRSCSFMPQDHMDKHCY